MSNVHPRVQQELDSLGVDYDAIEIDPEHADTATFCEKYGYPLESSGNTILVASKKTPKRYVACVIRADRKVDVNHRLRELTGEKRLSFARAGETAELTGQEIGSVTFLGLPEDVPIYVDDQLLEAGRVIVGGGLRMSKVSVSPEIFRRHPRVEIVERLGIGD